METHHYIELDKLPFVLEVLLFVSLTKCRAFSAVLCASVKGRDNFIDFLYRWFKGFRTHFESFVKSETDILSMDSREIRALRKEIAQGMSDARGNIFDLCWYGHDDAVIELLDLGRDVNDRNELKRHTGLLHICAEKNNISLMRRLLPYNPDLNIRDRLLRTPLFYAAEKNNTECLQFLLEHGADPNSAERNDSPLLYWAINFSSLETLKTIF